MTVAAENNTALTAQAIRDQLEAAWRAADYHGHACICCERWPEPDYNAHHDLRTALIRAAFYATDRYRPGDGYVGPTELMVDTLAHDAAEAAIHAARKAVTDTVAERLDGLLSRETER
ncbi:MAG: hypothetical protein M3N29_04130 [Chloroflexota bacterium]|nr:hypothetical protein [Chloroflexota bacterium]